MSERDESVDQIIGRPDKPFHKPECCCVRCEDWKAANPAQHADDPDDSQRRAEIAARMPSDADLELISKEPWPDEAQPAASEPALAGWGRSDDYKLLHFDVTGFGERVAVWRVGNGWRAATYRTIDEIVAAHPAAPAADELAKLREENERLRKHAAVNHEDHKIQVNAICDLQSRLAAAESKLEAVKGLEAKWRDWVGAYAQCAKEIAALAETKP